MTKKDSTTDLLIQISSDISAIKQHLKDMNGKLITHERKFERCPEVHRELEVNLDSLKTEIEKVKTRSGVYIGLASGLAGALLVAILNFLVIHFSKTIGG